MPLSPASAVSTIRLRLSEAALGLLDNGTLAKLRQAGSGPQALAIKQRVATFNKLASMLDNKYPLDEALLAIWSAAGGSRGGRVARASHAWWRAMKEKGKSFSDALEGWVPLEERMMIRAGEKSGLGGGLRKATETAEREQQLHGVLTKTLTYPAMLLVATVLACEVFSSGLLPSLAQQLPRARWSGTAATMGAFVDVVSFLLVPIGVGAGAGVFGYFSSRQRFTGPIRIWLDRYPPYSFYRLITGTRFLLSFVAMRSAGIAEDEILTQIAGAASPYLRERLNGIYRHLRAGIPIGLAMKHAGFGFPDPAIIAELLIYSQLPDFNEVLPRIAGDWLLTSIQRLETEAKALRNVIIAVVTLTIGLLGLGIMDLQGQLGQMGWGY